MTSTHPPTHQTELVRSSLRHPLAQGVQVEFFADWETAFQHLRDHLLTAPECHAWNMVDPGYAVIVDPLSYRQRCRYSNKARETHGVSAQPLYDLYCSAVSADAADAARLGWVKSHEGVGVALGSSGILLILEAAVKTAFLGGQGDPRGTSHARQRADADDNCLPREGREGSTDESGLEGRASWGQRKRRLARESKWSADERLYYRVFRPTVQFIKRSHNRNRNMFGDLVGSDYALLKDVLPPRSQLKFAHWVDLRHACRRGG